MPDHVIPPYIEANFRLMTFVLTRAPKVSDFPREKYASTASRSAREMDAHEESPAQANTVAEVCSPHALPPDHIVCRVYRHDSLDLLFRHYYKQARS